MIKNTFGNIEVVEARDPRTDILQTFTHWDCECGIHSNTDCYCNKCGVDEEESPNSRVVEVLESIGLSLKDIYAATLYAARCCGMTAEEYMRIAMTRESNMEVIQC